MVLEEQARPACDVSYHEDGIKDDTGEEGPGVHATCGDHGYDIPVDGPEDADRRLQEKLLDENADRCRDGEHDDEPVCSGPWDADYVE